MANVVVLLKRSVIAENCSGGCPTETPERTLSFLSGVGAAIAGQKGLDARMAGNMAGSIELPDEMVVLNSLGGIVMDERLANSAGLWFRSDMQVLRDERFTVDLPQKNLVPTATQDVWHIKHISKDPVPWERELAGRDVVVGILDSGIAAHHPEFAGRGIHYIEFDSFGRPLVQTPRDEHGHGTHVAALVAGRNVGIAPAATLAVAKVLTRSDIGTLEGTVPQILAGFNWLLETMFRPGRAGVDLINLSFGKPGDPSFMNIIARVADSNILTIAAIGNRSFTGPDAPGSYPNVLSVGSADRRDRVAVTSAWGEYCPPIVGQKLPTLCAPGVAIVSAAAAGGYVEKSGTSMAAAIVSGIAAARVSYCPRLRLRPARLKKHLKKGLYPVNNKQPLRGGLGRIPMWPAEGMPATVSVSGD